MPSSSLHLQYNSFQEALEAASGINLQCSIYIVFDIMKRKWVIVTWDILNKNYDGRISLKISPGDIDVSGWNNLSEKPK